jgi:hypothetical protein
LILSPAQYWARDTDHEAPYYEVYSTPLLPHLRPKYSPIMKTNSSFEREEKFNCLGTTLMNENSICEMPEILDLITDVKEIKR